MALQECFKPCVDYTLSLLLGSDPDGDVLVRRAVRYSPDVSETEGKPCVQILPSRFFTEGIYGTHESLPTTPLKQVEGTPLLFGTERVERKGDSVVVHADIVASTYFMVTRYEETVRRDVRDDHGRFPGTESLPYRAGFIDRPIAEEYAALLRKWLRTVGFPVREPSRAFCLLPTHDVDFLRRYRRWYDPYRTAAQALLGRRPRRIIGEALGYAWGFRKDPWDTFEETIGLDRMTAQEPTYFLMVGGTGPHGGMYDIRCRAARRLVQRVRQARASIGLHTSYQAAGRPELIGPEKARLEEVCGFPIRRNRHHFLAWREVEDGWQLAKAGIDWDSTMGYADVAGFRLGVCHPMPLFDPIKMQPMGIAEHPLIVMDNTLSDAKYMNLSEEEALAYCTRLMDETRKHSGEFVMLWHNTTLAGASGGYHPRLYRRLLDYGAATLSDTRRRY